MKLRLSVNRTRQRPAVRAMVGVLSGTLLLGLTACEPVTIPDGGSGASGTAVEACPAGPELALANDPHSLYSTARSMGATTYWANGYTGAGIDVAVIDTGVVPLDGLNRPGKVIHGPDLSFESQSSYPNIDTFGHGTHMASIIGGRDTAFSAPLPTPGVAGSGNAYVNNSTHFMGIAPDARIVSLKVGDHNGAADVTQVIAAINWVVEHKNTDGLNIRVLNLSYGVAATESWMRDPLSYAVDQAWKAGIVVVAPAGNDGRAPKTPLNSPAYNENIIAVGAYDPATNTVPDFSNDSGRRLPDFVAPGKSIAGLAACGTDQDNDIALDKVEAEAAGTTWTSPYVGSRFVRGSGTSQAAAVTAGAVALMVQKNPCWSVRSIKSVLRESAKNINGTRGSFAGQGKLDLAGTYNETRPCGASLGAGFSNGTGSIEGSRAGNNLWDSSEYCADDGSFLPATWDRLVAMFPGLGELFGSAQCGDWGYTFAIADGKVLRGEIDIFGKPFNGAAHAALTHVDPFTHQINGPGAWTTTPEGEMWNGSLWTGTGFMTTNSPLVAGPIWQKAGWKASAWNGNGWTSSDWTKAGWKDMEWDKAGWKKGSWRAGEWRKAGWKASDWTKAGWKKGSWRKGSWRAHLWE